MPNDRVKKEEEKLAKRQEQLRKARDAERIQKRKLASLKRNQRTHRLCVRDWMLESFLKRPGYIDPGDLEDEQVKAFLDFVFSLPAVQRKRNEMLLPDGITDGMEDTKNAELTL